MFQLLSVTTLCDYVQIIVCIYIATEDGHTHRSRVAETFGIGF